MIKPFIFHNYNIKCIGLSYRDSLITSKMSYPSVILIIFSFGDITLSTLSMITTPFGYDDYETLYSSLVYLYIYIKNPE